MNGNTPNTPMMLAMIFSATGDHLAGIAAPMQPKTLSEHLLSLFMAVTEFYNGDADLSMPPELVVLLRDMYSQAHQAHGAHALELLRAVNVIAKRAGLRNDAGIRIALTAANTALLQIVL
jgi:hypothetical protein